MAYGRAAREVGTKNDPLSTAERRIRDGKGRKPVDVAVTITWTVSPDDYAVAVGEDDMTVAEVRESVRTWIENEAYPPPEVDQVVNYDARSTRPPRALTNPPKIVERTTESER